VVHRREMLKRESYRRGGSHHGFGGWRRGAVWPDGEEQSAAVMKLGVSVLGARRGKSGGRRRCGEAMGCSCRPFIGVEAGRWAVREELDGQRRWVLMTFSMPVMGLKIEGMEGKGIGWSGDSATRVEEDRQRLNTEEHGGGEWTFNENDGFKAIRREGEAVGCQFGGGGEATWTTRLLGWGARCGSTSACGGRPLWVAAVLSREEEEGVGGPVNGPKDRVG
jgi:hypothetical protein